MKTRLNQTGIGHVAMLLVVFVVAAVAFAGYYVLSANDKATNNDTSEIAKDSDTGAIKTTSDLEKVNTELEGAAAQLDKDLDISVLDNDIDQLL